MLPDLSSTSITAEVGRATVSAERFTTHGPPPVPVPGSPACTVTLPVIDDPAVVAGDNTHSLPTEGLKPGRAVGAGGRTTEVAGAPKPGGEPAGSASGTG